MQHPEHRHPGRPREFDEDSVLRAAREMFWDKGFEATSLTDLTGATGLHKGSLYKAFGDKRSLFLQSLQHYMDEMFADMQQQAASQKTPLAQLRAILGLMTDKASGEENGIKGCMAVNSVVELAGHDEGVKAILTNSFRKHDDFLAAIIAEAQTAGEITDPRDSHLLAIMLMTFMAGLSAMIKGPLERPQAEMMIEEFIAAW